MEDRSAPLPLERSCQSNRIHCQSDSGGSSGKHPRRPRRRVVTRRLSILAPQHYQSCHARINPTDVIPRSVRFPYKPVTTDIFSMHHFLRDRQEESPAGQCVSKKSARPATVIPDAVPTTVSLAAAVIMTQQEHVIEDAVAIQVEDKDTAAGELFVRREDVNKVHFYSGGVAPSPMHSAASLVDEKQQHDLNNPAGGRIVG
jgi:hypothetical protein